MVGVAGVASASVHECVHVCAACFSVRARVYVCACISICTYVCVCVFVRVSAYGGKCIPQDIEPQRRGGVRTTSRVRRIHRYRDYAGTETAKQSHNEIQRRRVSGSKRATTRTRQHSAAHTRTTRSPGVHATPASPESKTEAISPASTFTSALPSQVLLSTHGTHRAGSMTSGTDHRCPGK